MFVIKCSSRAMWCVEFHKMFFIWFLLLEFFRTEALVSSLDNQENFSEYFFQFRKRSTNCSHKKKECSMLTIEGALFFCFFPWIAWIFYWVLMERTLFLVLFRKISSMMCIIYLCRICFKNLVFHSKSKLPYLFHLLYLQFFCNFFLFPWKNFQKNYCGSVFVVLDFKYTDKL